MQHRMIDLAKICETAYSRRMPKINGPLLRRARRSRGESVEQVAPDLELQPGSLRNVENMRGEASDRVIALILERFPEIDEKALRTVPPPVPVPRVTKKRAVLKTRSVA